jgi:hypothetical protein
VVILTAWSLYPWVKSAHYPMHKGLGGSQKRLELFGAQHNFLPLSGIKLRLSVVQLLAWSLSQFFVLQNTVGTTLKKVTDFSIIYYITPFLELKVKGDSYILTFYVLMRHLYFNCTVKSCNSTT